MEDPYQILGVKRGDADTAIRDAYRKLAKKHHPDLNPGKPEAAERFKKIAVAYDLLSDTDKRARFDRGEIDASGAERAPARPSYRDFTDDSGRAGYRADPGFATEDLEGVFAQAFGHRARAGKRAAGGRGADARYGLTVSFVEAAAGAVRRIVLPDGRTLDVNIPAGTLDGQSLRLRGQGSPGIGAAPAGDALIEIGIAPHPFFRREGLDVLLDLPVTVQEAVVGASIEVPTIRGAVKLSIPAGSGSGTRLRLKDRGIGGGHQYVVLRVVVPAGLEPALAAFLKTWTPDRAFDPRAELRQELEREAEAG